MSIKQLLVNRIASNALWIIVSKGIQAVLGLVLSMVAARYLGPANYGLLNYAVSITLFVGPFAQLGYTATLVHELLVSPENEGEVLGSAILSSLISSFLCMIGISLFVFLVNPGEQATILVCQLYSILLIAQALELIQYWFHARLLAKYVAAITLVCYILLCAYQLFVLIRGKSLYWYVVSKGAEHLLIALALLVVYRKLSKHRLSFSWSRMGALLRNSRHYILSSIMLLVYQQTDRIMIKSMISNEAMGFYSAAVVCANATDFVFFALIDSIRPVILEARQLSQQKYEEKTTALYSIIIYLSIIQSVFIAILAKPVVYLLYGSAYMPAVAVLRLLIWYTAFSYYGSARSIWILAEGKQRYLWVINLSGALLNVGLNVLLIPRWHIEGAAFASLVTQIFINVIIGFLYSPLKENNRLLTKSLDPRSMLLLFEKE